jgi:hypothetical protein
MVRVKWIPAVMLVAFLLPGCARKTTATDSADQQRAASVMLDRFETVFHTNGDLLSGSGGYKGLSQQDANEFRVPFAYLLGGLDALGKPASNEILRSSGAVLAGAKDFRGPHGPWPHLGAVQSQFCYVIVLQSQSTFDLGKVLSKSSAVSSAEASTWKWSAAGTEGHPEPHQFYATQVAGSYVLISNNLDDLHQVSAQLSSNDHALNLSGIRDWESISQHEVWGYRTYRHSEGENKDAAGTVDVTPDAQALAFFFDAKQKAGVLRLFSPTAGTADKMNGTNLLSPFKATGSGAWETIIPLTGDQKSSDQMFVAMSWFGFGIYV